MVRHPKTLPASASVGDVRDALANDHVHMVLLTEGATLRGTVVRGDLPEEAAHDEPALARSVLAGRTVPPDASLDQVQEALARTGVRRLAVVDHEGTLLGLLCMKRSRTGFCSDADVRSRAEASASARGCTPS